MTGAATAGLGLADQATVSPSLVVTDAVVRVGKRYLELPDLTQVGAGLLLIEGPNGAGKTTMLEAIAGSVATSRGEICLQGVVAERAMAHRRFCRAEVALLDDVPLARQAALFAMASSVTPVNAARELASAGLGQYLSTQPRHLSTGQRRLAWVILSTLGSAPIRLLDEPFAGLDNNAAELIAARIRLWASTRLVVVVSHDGPELQPLRRIVIGSRA